MAQITIGERSISRIGSDVYIIAEVGQNHQGSLEIAKRMIEVAKDAECDCVKFQKSNLCSKFTKEALKRPYCGPNSWGPTYGEHKRYLEFTDKQYLELQGHANKIGIDFAVSAMDEASLAVLNGMDVQFLKIGSGDANNFPLLSKAAHSTKPLIISTGMQKEETLNNMQKLLLGNGKDNFAVLHCVSSYPTKPSDCCLQMISKILTKFPNNVVGYSGHEEGITISLAAVLLGARILERHMTLNKLQRGSDHVCSLDPDELKKLVYGVRCLKLQNKLVKHSYTPFEIIEILGNSTELIYALRDIKEKDVLPCEFSCILKLGKSVVASRDIYIGKKLEEADLAIKVSEPRGIPAEEYYEVIGLTALFTIQEDQAITCSLLK